MERIHKLCEEQSLMPPAELSVLRSALARPAEDSLAHFSSLVQSMLPCEPVQVTSILKRSRADWLKPLPNEGKPVVFPSSLSHPIRVEALLSNISRDDRPFVLITLPDQSVQVWPLRAGDLKPLGPNKFRLTTAVNLYVRQPKWTEACSVTLDLVLPFCLDAPGTDLHHTTAHVLGGGTVHSQPEWKGPPTSSDKLRCLHSSLLRLSPTHLHDSPHSQGQTNTIRSSSFLSSSGRSYCTAPSNGPGQYQRPQPPKPHCW